LSGLINENLEHLTLPKDVDTPSCLKPLRPVLPHPD